MSVLPSTALGEDALELIKNDTPYLALFTDNPGPAATGTEVSGGSYARQSITFGTISSAAMSNTNTITFSSLPTATATHFGIFDAVSSGNLLVYGELTSPIVATSGDDATFAIGEIDINITGS